MARFVIISSLVAAFSIGILSMVTPRSPIQPKSTSPIQKISPVPNTTTPFNLNTINSHSPQIPTTITTTTSRTAPPIDRRRTLLSFGCTCTLCTAASLLATTPSSQKFSDEIYLLDRVETRMANENTLDARFARVMAGGMADYEASAEVRRFKQDLFNGVKRGDKVLEIGVGSGPNLSYYGKKAGIVLAVEPNRSFDMYTRSAAATTGTTLEIIPGRAESIPMPDASVDVVVGTMVLCSVESVEASLKEVHRVLRFGGRFLFTEHTKAPEDWHLLSLAQKIVSPIQIAFAEGCHLRREPRKEIERVFGVTNVEARNFVLEGTNQSPPWPPHFLLAPHLVGYAIKT